MHPPMQVPDHSCRSLILTPNVVLRIMHMRLADKCSDKRSSSERNVSVNASSAFRFMRAIRSDVPVDCQCPESHRPARIGPLIHPPTTRQRCSRMRRRSSATSWVASCKRAHCGSLNHRFAAQRKGCLSANRGRRSCPRSNTDPRDRGWCTSASRHPACCTTRGPPPAPSPAPR